MKTINQLVDVSRQDEPLAELKKISQRAIEKQSETKRSEQSDREFLKDSLAHKVLTVIVTIWPSEDKRLADEDTFLLAKNLFKNEFKGLTSNQIEYGIERITGQKFPPTPHEFRKLCTPSASELGMQEFEDCFTSLQRRITDKDYQLTKPTAWIYQHLDCSLLMDGQRQPAARRHVEYYYEMCRGRLLRRESLDLKQPRAIEHLDDKETVSEQDVLDAMAKLGLKATMKVYADKLRSKK